MNAAGLGWGQGLLDSRGDVLRGVVDPLLLLLGLLRKRGSADVAQASRIFSGNRLRNMPGAAPEASYIACSVGKPPGWTHI